MVLGVPEAGRRAGTRALIEAPLLHRRLPAASVTVGITASLGRGRACSPVEVAVSPQAPGPALRSSRAAVITLPRRTVPLLVGTRLVPDTAIYDQMLAFLPRADQGSHVWGKPDELTEPAMDAAIERACTILRLPTVRDRCGEVAGSPPGIPVIAGP